jgi:Chaperone of endosialidase
MALNFPSPATNGQTWTDPTGRQWVYDTGNNSWTAKGGAAGGMVYKGGIDITTAPPAGVQSGWLYAVTTGGTANAGFTGLTGTVPVGSQVVYGGPNWQLLSAPGPWSRTGTELSPATAGDSVFTTGAVKVGGTTAAPNLQLKADGGIVANTNGLFYDAATKHLGIGTAAPGSTLTVKGATGATPLQISGPSSEFARIDSSGRLLVGTTAPRVGVSLEVEGVTAQTSGAAITRNTADGGGPSISLCKSRSSSRGSNTIVQLGDGLGDIVFYGADGASFRSGAQISAIVDATPGANDMPGRLVFSTTADGASSPTERMRITNQGAVCINGTFAPYGDKLTVFSGVGAAPAASFWNETTSGNVAVLDTSLKSHGATTSSYHLKATTQSVANWYLYGNGTSSFTSDARKKKNIETTRDGYLEDLSKLRVVKYNWFNQEDGDPKELGLIAQEVEQVFPGLVQEADKLEGDDFNCKVLKGSVLPFMLLKALQEATARIESLETRLAALEPAPPQKQTNTGAK